MIIASDTHPLIGAQVRIDTDKEGADTIIGWIVWACLMLDAEQRPLGCHFVIVGDDGAFNFRQDEHITVTNPSAAFMGSKP